MSQVFSNNAYSAIQGNISNVDTTIALGVGDGALFNDLSGDGDYEYYTIHDAYYTKWEVVKATARSTDSITVVRGVEGVQQAWTTGALVSGNVTAGSLQSITTAATTAEENAAAALAGASGPKKDAAAYNKVTNTVGGNLTYNVDPDVKYHYISLDAEVTNLTIVFDGYDKFNPNDYLQEYEFAVSMNGYSVTSSVQWDDANGVNLDTSDTPSGDNEALHAVGSALQQANTTGVYIFTVTIWPDNENFQSMHVPIVAVEKYTHTFTPV